MNSLFPSALWEFLDFQAADEVKGKERIGRALFKIYAIAVSPVRSTGVGGYVFQTPEGVSFRGIGKLKGIVWEICECVSGVSSQLEGF